LTTLRTDLAPFLAPRTAVVLGASERSGVARHLLANLVRGGCAVSGTHPRTTSLDGALVVPSVADLDHVPDIACVALGAATIGAGMEDALEAGVRHFVVPGLGPEAGPEGVPARARVAELCVRYGAAMIGPNGMGVYVPGGPSAWIGSVAPSLRPGPVGILVESGSIGEALTGIGPRLGIRTIISSGNETARDAADVVAFLAGDPRTTAIGLMLETVRRPEAFRAALRLAAAAGKPVSIVKTGTSAVGAERAMAHSGAIAGSDAAFDALCRTHGVIRAADYGDWVEVLEVLGSGSRPRGRRLVVVSNSGGEAEHAADAAERAGMPLVALPADLAAKLDADWALHGAANPLDYYAFAPQEEILPAVMRDAAAHPDVDGVLLNIDQSWRFVGSERETGIFAADVAVATRRETGTFVALLSTSTNDAPDHVLETCAAAGVPVIMGHGPGFRALAAITAPAPAEVDAGPRVARADRGPLPAADGPMPEYDSKRWLVAYGLRDPGERRATTAEEAVAAAEELGYPVVVKADGPAHKEREGGVHLGCATPAMVRGAAEACGGRALVARELKGGVEVLCGLVRDPLFGPMVVCGVGGSWAEAMKESARTALAPLTLAAAENLVRAVVPVARRLDAVGITAVARTLVALGDAAADEPRVAEIDVNPLRVVGADAVALDALIVLGGPA
jgi:acetyltransferase